MTQEQKRIKLAEAGGWKQLRDGRWKLNGKVERFIPDYFNDLNAVHELEQQIWAQQWSLRDKFCDILALIMNPVHGYRGLSASDALDATAVQRCEALGKTLNLW